MMTFAEADAQYELVKQRYQAGALTDEEYDDQLRELMVLDDQGRWWAKSRENGVWHYYDAASESWLLEPPPVTGPSAPPVQSTSPASAAASPTTGQPAASTAAASAGSAAGAGAVPGGGQANLPKWAAVAPATVQQAGSSGKPAASAAPAPAVSPAGQAAPSVPAPAGYSAREFGPIAELSGSLKVVFYILALLVPVLGFVLYFVYRKKPAQADRSAARIFLILGVASLVFSCLASAGILLLESVLLGAAL